MFGNNPGRSCVIIVCSVCNPSVAASELPEILHIFLVIETATSCSYVVILKMQQSRKKRMLTWLSLSDLDFFEETIKIIR